MSSKSLRVEDQVQYVWAAIQYLQHDRPLSEIADKLGVSRHTAGRMVRRAREAGLVEVVPRLSSPIDAELSRALVERFKLQSALAVLTPPSEQDDQARPLIAQAAATLVAELITEDDVIGLTSGRTILEMCGLIKGVPTCDVVQLTGVAVSDAEQALDSVMTLSRVAKGRMFPLHAPLLATDAHAARIISRQPAVKQALHRMNSLHIAVVTIGGWPQSSLLAQQLQERGELEELTRQGVVAEIGTTLLDEHGRELHTLEGHLIGISTEQLVRVPTKVAIGGGAGKERAVRAALRAGLVNVLVTDTRTARAVLDTPSN
jgi:DNA-binding transcriptional regulator LsrR (DeoR family)